MAFDPGDHQVEFCADGSNLHITQDGGLQWETVKDFPDNRLYSLALSQNNPKSIYLGSSGVIHSPDGGASWEFLDNGLGTDIYEFVVNPGDPTALYLMEPIEDNLWTLLKGSEEIGNFDKLVFDYPGFPTFDNSGSIYISKGNELYKYNTEKNNLDLISSVDSQSDIRFVSHPFKQDMIYGTGDTNDFFRSGDSGHSWEKFNTEGVGPRRLFFNANDPAFIYSSTKGPTFLSLNDGSNWRTCAVVEELKPDSGSAMAIDPRPTSSNTYRVYMATTGAGLMISSDNCQSWTSVKSPFRSMNINSVVIDPNNPDTVYVGTDAGAYASYDKGDNWNEISNGLPGGEVVYSILVRQDGKVFAATPFGVFRLESK
jgi:photosystem II stability/assembly factor-like uncharacterized protein